MNQRREENHCRKKLILWMIAIMVVLAAAQAIICRNNPLTTGITIAHLASAAIWGVKAYRDPYDDKRVHSSAGLKMLAIAAVTAISFCVAILASEELELLRWAAAILATVGMFAELSVAMDWPDQELTHIHLIFAGAVLLSIYFFLIGNNPDMGFLVMVVGLIFAIICNLLKIGSSGGNLITLALHFFGAFVAGIVRFLAQSEFMPATAISTFAIGFIIYAWLMVLHHKGQI